MLFFKTELPKCPGIWDAPWCIKVIKRVVNGCHILICIVLIPDPENEKGRKHRSPLVDMPLGVGD